MKTPDACMGLPDIREAIDRLDADIIDALGRRMQYVLAASRFKPDEASIAAPERVAAMLPDRRRWAEQAGLDADYVETLFLISFAKLPRPASPMSMWKPNFSMPSFGRPRRNGVRA